MTEHESLTVGLAQIAPSGWTGRRRWPRWSTGSAARRVRLRLRGVRGGPGPGLSILDRAHDGARFESPLQKEFHAHYLDQAVQIEAGHLDGVCDAASRLGIAVMLGIIERPADRGGHSIYCSRVHIGADGAIASVHRKLMPTYEERLSWAPGDGHGLRVHRVGAFTVGGLNCYENWMPLTRAGAVRAGRGPACRAVARQPPQHPGHHALPGPRGAQLRAGGVRPDAQGGPAAGPVG